MDKLQNVANTAKGGASGGSGGGGGGGGGDYVEQGLNQAEQKAGGKYYDQDKVKGVNKTVGDKVKDKFQEVTGHSLPGTK